MTETRYESATYEFRQNYTIVNHFEQRFLISWQLLDQWKALIFSQSELSEFRNGQHLLIGWDFFCQWKAEIVIQWKSGIFSQLNARIVSQWKAEILSQLQTGIFLQWKSGISANEKLELSANEKLEFSANEDLANFETGQKLAKNRPHLISKISIRVDWLTYFVRLFCRFLGETEMWFVITDAVTSLSSSQK